jgi:nitrate reductase gamma subunit
MAYYFAIAVGIIVVFGITGITLRRGTPRLD